MALLREAGDTPSPMRAGEITGPFGSHPAGPPPPEAGREVAGQIIAAIRASHGGEVELRLSPEELGHVKLTMQVENGLLTVTVEAERPETLDLMRRNVELLLREFREAGYPSLNLTFGAGTSSGGERRTGAPRGASSDPLSREDPCQTRSTESIQQAGSARLDIRI